MQGAKPIGHQAMHTRTILQQSKSWQDFKAGLWPLDKKAKGDAFETLTYYYLLLHPEYQTKLSNIWFLRDVPRNVRKKLNLPGPDEGIDLVAKTKEGDYWAIQCKYREDESKSLTRKDLSTFTDLAFGICRNISLALVCTTADRYSYKLKRYENRISFCTGDKWRELDTEFFTRLHRYLAGRVALPKPLKPRPHQQEAIRNAFKHFVKEENKRGKLIMPCGTGKSLASFWIAEKLQIKSVLIAVPSLALIRQTLAVWARESVAKRKDIHWICVCSDETVGKFEKQDLAVLTQDLGVRVHTDPKEIAAWLRKTRKGLTVVMTTYQSGPVIAKASRNAQRVFDLGIMDEAHKTVGKKGSLFSHLLYDKNIRIRKRIFMTATERRYLGRSEDIASMDDPDLYGDTFELLSFKEALESDPPILSDYRIVTIMVTRAEIAELIEKNLFVRPDKGRWDREVEAEMLASAVALRKAIQSRPIKHAVSFHTSIARATAFKATQDIINPAFPEFKKLQTFHVSGNTPTAVRAREIDEFKSVRRGLITNARCLTEGIDVPNIDCVLFADPKRSTVDIVQAVGRALRPAVGKRRGYVVVPVLLDAESKGGELLHSDAFDAVLTTLRGLAANDERIVEHFRAISQGRKLRRGSDPVDIDIPLSLKIDADEFVNAIELKFWSRLARLSWRPFEEAREFVRGLGLGSSSEWRHFCNGEMVEKGIRPHDVPALPNRIYKDKGWKSYGDWLGSGTIAPQLREYRSFENARGFVQSLGLKNQSQWREYTRGGLPAKRRLPKDIPLAPEQTYKGKGWKSWGDWLGTRFVAHRLRQYRSYREARAYARSLGLSSVSEWRRFCRGRIQGMPVKPDDIPADPHRIYKGKGWKDYGHWLGTGAISTRLRKYRPFKRARTLVHRLRLRNYTQWRQFCKGELREMGAKPDDIPTNPNQIYKDDGWAGWGNWLGTGNVAPSKRQYRSFDEAREFARSLRLRSQTEWIRFCKGQMSEKGTKPNDIPADPNHTYKEKGWKGYGDWLGTGNIANFLREYRPFGQARAFVRSLKLRSETEWRLFCKGQMPEKGTKPDDIPANPSSTYKGKGWAGMGDWLGTGIIANRFRLHRSFEKARIFARSLALNSREEWMRFCRGKMPRKGMKPNH